MPVGAWEKPPKGSPLHNGDTALEIPNRPKAYQRCTVQLVLLLLYMRTVFEDNLRINGYNVKMRLTLSGRIVRPLITQSRAT